MNTIPHESILRYYPKDASAHSTAVKVEGTVLEVKREGHTVRNRYPSVDVWLLSFPGASWSEVVVSHPADKEKNVSDEKEVGNETETGDKETGDKETGDKETGDKETGAEEKQQQNNIDTAKAEKTKKTEKVKLHLIPASQQIYSVMWTHHLHRLMKEANPSLLKRETVIRAFNQLVAVLVEYQSHVYTICPALHARYEEHTVLPDMTRPNKELSSVCNIGLDCVRRDPDTGRMVIHRRYYRSHDPVPNKEELLISRRILSAYLLLLDLIRGNILPYMEHMRKQQHVKYVDKQVKITMERMEKVQEKFEVEQKRRNASLERFASAHEKSMLAFRTIIAELLARKSE